MTTVSIPPFKCLNLYSENYYNYYEYYLHIV